MFQLLIMCEISLFYSGSTLGSMDTPHVRRFCVQVPGQEEPPKKYIYTQVLHPDKT
jgi:hypothetical protein